MALSPGTRLGPYEILSAIGAGGMGEVYRAKDTRLDRTVAIKILPTEISTNSDSLRRFEQEARAASSLNHPNIITIYEIGFFDSTSYIAMEFVEGKTLRELTASGPLAGRKAVQLATQICEGLTAAHEAGIVHRDLKPENIIVNKDGHTKILDFGLAKLFAPTTDQISTAFTVARTDAGVVLGTVGYMSPEQASGKEVDFRSDQFSLGAILYELISGKRAFQKKSNVETLAAIIQEEPDPISSAGPPVPAPLRWMIERCLQKDPADRYSSTRDLSKELQNIRDHFSELSVSVDDNASPPAFMKWKRRFYFLIGIASALFIILGAIFFLRRDTKVLEPQPLAYHRITYRRGPIQSARFTSDGESIVYSGSFAGQTRDLYLARPEATESRPLDVKDAEILSISANGDLLVDLIRDNKKILAQMQLTGGSPRELAESVYGADWAPDGSSMAISTMRQGKYYIEWPPGHVLYETANIVDRLRISSNAHEIACLEHVMGGSNGSVFIIDRNGKKVAESKECNPDGIAWNTSGREVWFTTSGEAGSGLYALPDSGLQRRVSGFPSYTSIVDISRQGKVMVATNDDRGILMLNKKNENTPRDLSWLDRAQISDFSPDGKQLLIWERGEGSGGEYGAMFVRGIDGSPAVKLTDGVAMAFLPDGKRVLGDAYTKILIVPIGAGDIRSYPFPEFDGLFSVGILPDGKNLIFQAIGRNKQSRVYLLAVDGGKPKAITPEGVVAVSGDYIGHLISPDGKWIVTRDNQQHFSLYPIESGSSVGISGIEPGEEPVQWMPDGLSILACDPGKIPGKVFRIRLSDGKRELYQQIVPPDPIGFTAFKSILFSADGSMYAYSFTRSLSTLYVIDGIR